MIEDIKQSGIWLISVTFAFVFLNWICNAPLLTTLDFRFVLISTVGYFFGRIDKK